MILANEQSDEHSGFEMMATLLDEGMDGDDV